MRFRRALILCSAGVLAMGIGVMIDSRRAVAGAATPFAPVPMHARGLDMAGANRIPAGQSHLPTLPGG